MHKHSNWPSRHQNSVNGACCFTGWECEKSPALTSNVTSGGGGGFPAVRAHPGQTEKH